MNPVTHLLTGWTLAEGAGPRLDARSRALVAWAAVIPDLDGFGYPFQALTANTRHELLWFSEYHHKLHTLLFALACTALAAIVARRRRALTALLTLAAFHLHLAGDLAGARGPDGEQWPLPYLAPWRDAEWSWPGQWPLNGWQNILITVTLMALAFFLAWKRGYSPVGLFSKRADGAFVAALRGRLGNPRS